MSRLMIKYINIISVFFLLCFCQSQEIRYSQVKYNDDYVSKTEDQKKSTESVIDESALNFDNSLKKNKRYKFGIVIKNEKPRFNFNNSVFDISYIISSEIKNVDFYFINVDENGSYISDIENSELKDLDILYFPFLNISNNRVSLLKNRTNAKLLVFTKSEYCSFYDNSLCLDVYNQGKVSSILDILDIKQRSHLSFILPNDNKGYIIAKELKNNKDKHAVYVRNTEFFSEGDKNSILNAVRNLKNNFTKNMLIDKSTGSIVKVSSKSKLKDKNDNLELKKFNTDSLYILCNANDLDLFVKYLKDFNILDKDILIFLDMDLNISKVANNVSLKDFFFVGFNGSSKDLFDEVRMKQFNVKSNYIDYFLYDSIAFISRWLSDSSNISLKDFYTVNSFEGILGRLRFKESKLIREYDLYKLDQSGNFFKYFSLEN